MKRIVLIVIVLVAVIGAAIFYFMSNDKLALDDLAAIKLTTATGSIDLKTEQFQPYLDLYNRADWQASSQADDWSTGASLDVDLTLKDDVQHSFKIVDQNDGGLWLVKGRETAYLSDVANRAQLFDEEILFGEPFVAPSLELNSWQLTPASGTLQYRDLFGDMRTKSLVDGEAIAAQQFVINEPKLALSPLIGSDLPIESISVTTVDAAAETALELTADHSFKPVDQVGTFNYKIVVKTDEMQFGVYRGPLTLVYNLTLEQRFAPQVKVLQERQTIGGFFLIKGRYFDDQTQLVIAQSLTDATITAYPLDGAWVAAIPVDYYTDPGDYELVFYAQRGDQKIEVNRQNVTVEDREFAMQNLRISASKERSTRSEEAYRQHGERFKPVRQTTAAQKLWQGQFIMPIEGRLTTDYGERRKVNEALTRYRHSGLDLAAPEGTEIMASNSGKVVFSEQLILTGNTIVIDHGLGFFTYYLHMSERFVEVGEMVEKGQFIGAVGSTGFSTGPHLHFTASYHMQNINPYLLIDWDGTWNDATETE